MRSAAGGPRPAARSIAGETHEEGLRRELLEEAGIAAPIGPCVWTRVHEFEWGEHFVRQVERYYVVRVESDEIAPQLDLAAEDVQEIRWWTLAELEASDEEFAPRRLPQLIRRAARRRPARAAVRRRRVRRT